MGGCIFLLKYSTFLRMSLIKPLSPCLSNPIKRYSLASKGHHHHHHNKHEMKERAPSTAEEFKRMAEEKLRETEQGVASQVLDKVYDATEEATLSEAKLETLKKRCIEHEPGADYRSRGDNDQDHVDRQ